ncbi:MAG: hypothetical protein AAF170_12745 [Bacteroidota bacterium]
MTVSIRILSTAPILMALLLFAADALAQTPMRRSGTLQRVQGQIGVQTGAVTTGGISGRRGTDVVTLTRGENTLLSALYIGDGDDQNSEVCYVQAHFWSKPSPTARLRQLKRRFDLCSPQLGRDPQPGQVRFHRVGFETGGGPTEAYSGDSFRIARGIQTCATSGVPYTSDRSVVFYEADVDRNGDITPRDDITDIYLNGQTATCRDNRQAARMCPSGQAVVGVDVHYRKSGGKTLVLGLAPKCAPLTVSAPQGLTRTN